MKLICIDAEKSGATRGGGNTMEKNSEKLEKINTRIARALADPGLKCSYQITDSSVQAEIRLWVEWSIRLPVDAIGYPKSLGPETAPWPKMRALQYAINGIARIKSRNQARAEKINIRRQNGAALREAAATRIRIEEAATFLPAHRSALRRIPALNRKITALQAEQKILLPEMRRANSEYFQIRKVEKTTRARADTDALASGKFWEASKEAVKNYFHPPFARNYLADVSAQWRAALYTEMGSTAWKAGKGDWRHKNTGTGYGYLCGIDDNGDEWGHHVDLSGRLRRDSYGDYGYVATVEQAMGELFGLRSLAELEAATRQGDLLFVPEKEIPADVELRAQPEPWTVRESHTVASPGLRRDGRWFAADAEIVVEHTSHHPVVLPPGKYRLYALPVADAD
jgi:hypothetical protein